MTSSSSLHVAILVSQVVPVLSQLECHQLVMAATARSYYGVQHLIADVDPAVGMLLSELILILGEAGSLTPTAHGEPPQDGQPRRGNVLALAFLINQTARSQVEVDRSCVSMLVPKKTFLTGQAALWKSAVFQGGHFDLSVHLIFPVVGRASCA